MSQDLTLLWIRISRPRVFCKRGVLRNFSKFAGKHLCQSYFFNKLYLKKGLAQVFSCEFWEISKNIIYYKTPLVAWAYWTLTWKTINEIRFTIVKRFCKPRTSIFLEFLIFSVLLIWNQLLNCLLLTCF